MERDLKTLRRSRLMNYSEFRNMTTALERHHKDVKVAFMTCRKENDKELDLRPYLYDEGDSYEKPFYNTLLKMLYEVATSHFHEKQYEDLKKIYKWYNANKKLISSPPVVPIPEPPKQKDDSSSKLPDDEHGDEDELGEKVKFKEVPKLHMRPKTAPPIESKKGVRYVTWNEAQGRNGAIKRPGSGKAVFRYQNKEHFAREYLGKALKISQIGNQSKDGSQTDQSYHPSFYVNRPGTAPPYTAQVKFQDNDSVKSFILKPYSTPVPMSSPINSPLASPRDSPVPFRCKSPQLSVDFSPQPAKEPAVKLSVRMPKEKDDKNDNRLKTSCRQDKNVDKEDQKEEREYPELPSKLQTSQPIPENPTSSQLEHILKNQKREEGLLEEQHNLLQTKLLHEYDRYARECAAMEKERKAKVEMMDGHVALNMNGGQHGQLVHPSTVGTYDLSYPDTIPSYNRTFSKPKEAHSRSKSAGSPNVQSGFSPARHLRHTTVPYNRPDEVHVNAVLSMVTPIGMQMECDRERANGYVSPGMKQPSTPIPQHVTLDRTPDQQIHRETSTVSQSSSVCSSILDMDSPRSSLSTPTPLELKNKEPELNRERTDRDYKVHFHQDKSPSDANKNFKTSGPVCPDSIRYQWTDDGFGSMTYMKKLKSPISPRSPKKKPNVGQTSKQSPPEHVTLPSSSRSLDKRTLASLMLVKQLGESDRRDGRFGGCTERSATAPPPDHVDYNYKLEYMSFCQPVGPRLGETDRPSTVAWYLQGDHGLYKEHSMRYDSEEIHKKDVRIAQDRSLMIEGRHIGGDADQQESKPMEKPTANEENEKKNKEPKKEIEASENTVKSHKDNKELAKPARASLRPTSPRPKRPLSASSCEHHHISIPTGKGFGTASRPCSARSDRSEKTYSFSVKQFKHFCWPDEAVLSDDYIRQREVWAAVNIQRIFRGYMARQYYLDLRDAERERRRRAALTLQSHLRGFLTRKRMENKMKDYTPTTRTKEWARKYKEELKQREAARMNKKNFTLIKLNKEAEKLDESIKQVKAHQHIFDIYHPVKEGPTKAEMKAAAITIQRYFRGWFVRKMYQKVKAKALKRTLSFNKFIKDYQSLLYRIQKRYGVKDPSTDLQFNELMEYVERLNKYEIAFEKFAVNGVLSYNDIKEYFKAVGHVPSQKEIDEAIEIVTKMPAQGRSLTKAEAVEILFQIYVPRGTGMKLSDVRKSTWLNPLNDGQDIMQLLSKKDLEATNLAKCLSLVANAGKDNEEIQDLLRPSSAKSATKKTENKKGRSRDKERHVTLAQYPMRPSSSASSRSRSKSPKPPKR
ncbi:uncharacterized protein LOC116288619 isoform X2 [Actinia tenebrosa]|uniref:Uncharacterized protein LOC116288619 isoform X2 n=1 Tax=Actinia tenebrosa TaxID=6105 RepID=A0A6P8HFB1_ACTTE|nr:uncharacterized protein LOC116288619 isoform X2 [Actinia tenebrosa]